MLLTGRVAGLDIYHLDLQQLEVPLVEFIARVTAFSLLK